MKYQSFIFKDYAFSTETKELVLTYSYDDKLTFQEKFRFDFEFTADLDEQVLARAIQSLFFIAGVSYYKAYLPEQIIIEKGQLDESGASFLREVYQKGLGEFFYTNKLDPKTTITFPVKAEPVAPLQPKVQPKGLLVGIGGGKDSLVTVEALRDQPAKVMTWSLNHRPQLTPLIERIGLPHAWVEREWDKQLLELNKQDVYNGHVPISAIFAAVGTIVNILTGTREHVVSNEHSANEPTLVYQTTPINHQYSKSQEFEQLFQKYLRNQFGDSYQYYSFLRPLSELMIGELFAKVAFEKYKDVFSSCNRAYIHSSDHMSWCGECPKCAFVFLVLTPFINREKLEGLWGGKNLLQDASLEPTYRALLGIEGDKPLDCVGEIKEVRAAMHLASKLYPELAEKYQFELPKDYDYRALQGHNMPGEKYQNLQKLIARL
jgi:UDP-N-acetyl-alpha-D-muramoyl-L-alanyl-L-glutamate epimerase